MGNELDLDLLNFCIKCKKCDDLPSTYWCTIPQEGCNIAGIVFLKREEDMQIVRRAKEELLELKILKKKTTDKTKLNDYEDYEKRLNLIVQKFAQYGADKW